MNTVLCVIEISNFGLKPEVCDMGGDFRLQNEMVESLVNEDFVLNMRFYVSKTKYN